MVCRTSEPKGILIKLGMYCVLFEDRAALKTTVPVLQSTPQIPNSQSLRKELHDSLDRSVPNIRRQKLKGKPGREESDLGGTLMLGHCPPAKCLR